MDVPVNVFIRMVIYTTSYAKLLMFWPTVSVSQNGVNEKRDFDTSCLIHARENLLVRAHLKSQNDH